MATTFSFSVYFQMQGNVMNIVSPTYVAAACALFQACWTWMTADVCLIPSIDHAVRLPFPVQSSQSQSLAVYAIVAYRNLRKRG